MLDFVADNYLWFIILGFALLAIAIILLFSRKKPIKEETAAVQPINTDNNAEVEPEIIEVTGNTETLEIVDDVAEQSANTFFEPVVSPVETVQEVATDVDPFAFEPQVVEQEVTEPLFEETVVMPVVEPVNEVIEEPKTIEPFVVDNVAETVQQPEVVEIFEQPVITDMNVSAEESLPKQNDAENSINVGDVVMPQNNINTDSVPVNNELDEDIWKF